MFFSRSLNTNYEIYRHLHNASFLRKKTPTFKLSEQSEFIHSSELLSPHREKWTSLLGRGHTCSPERGAGIQERPSGSAVGIRASYRLPAGFCLSTAQKWLQALTTPCQQVFFFCLLIILWRFSFSGLPICHQTVASPHL